MLTPRCYCGHPFATGEFGHGLALLRCLRCDALRQLVDMTPAQYAAFYRDRYADAGAGPEHLGAVHSYPHDRAVARVRLEAYALPAGARLLDAGCGNNAFVDEANAQGLEAYGFDLSAADPGERKVIGDVHAARAAFGARFDVVTVHDVLEHVPEPVRWLEELRDMLAPGGLLILDWPRFFAPDGAGVHHWRPVQHLWILQDAEVVELLDRAGFIVERFTHPIASKTVFYARVAE